MTITNIPCPSIHKITAKTILIISAFSYFSGCSASDYRDYKYEPEYEGKYVNSAEMLQALYKLPDDFFRTNDSLSSGFYYGYYLGRTFENINSNDSDKLQIIPYVDSVYKVKQVKYRGYIDYENEFTEGFKIMIYNFSDETVKINMQDGSLIMIQEAMDPKGKWKPIEYWAHSICGNSYGYVYLPPASYIDAGAFRYKGTFETKLRFKMQYHDGSKYMYIYSEPFKGSVNFSQFGKPRDIHLMFNFLE